MIYRHILILAVALTAIFAPSLAANRSELQQRRLERHRAESPAPAVSNQEFAAPGNLVRSLAPLFGDNKINSDNQAATFVQRHPDIAHFADGRGAAVWEDERNGVWKIAAQPLGLSGAAVGANRILDSSNPPASLRHPRILSNGSGVVLIVYVNETFGGLYGRTYDYGLNSGGTEFRIDDPVVGNVVSQPALALLSGNRFVVVWEDSRDGAAIYGQILAADGSKTGSNFEISGAIDSPYRIAPAAAANLSGDFGVVWEDGRTGNGDVYFRLFTDIGTPLFGELLIDGGHQADFQFMPQVEFLRGNGYLVTWISDRDGGQSIFGQLVSTSSAPIGSDFQINDAATDICWDLAMTATNDSGAVCLWAEYSATAAIQGQKVGKTGALTGTNFSIEDAGLLRERSYPAAAQNASGFTAVWIDERGSGPDIYAQRLSTTLTKSGVNYKLNDDVNGAQQTTPAVAGVTSVLIATAWQDRRSDQGDIYLQMVNANGNLFGAQIKLNDDAGRAVQSDPAVAGSSSSLIWAVWEDARTTAAGGQNIFAQRLDGGGNKQGDNIQVNSDGTAAAKSSPDVDLTSTGRAMMVWADERDGSKQIYSQKYTNTGLPLGTNTLVSTVAEAAENFEPHVGQRTDLSQVVAWMAIVGSKQTVYFQRYNTGNNTLSAPQMLAVDTTLVQVVDVDLFVHRNSGRFYIATIERAGGESQVRLYRYDADGNLELTPFEVSDNPGTFSDLRLAGDYNDALLVTWTSTSGGAQRGYLQLMRVDGFALGSNQPISGSTANRQELTPAATMIGGYYYCIWADNRNANAGFDIFMNSLQYTRTDAEDEFDAVVPRVFSLEQNYPNPFNPETVIAYALEKPAQVELSIFNVLGQKVATLVDAQQGAGSHEVRWNAANGNQPLASGVYFYKLVVDGAAQTRKMTLLK